MHDQTNEAEMRRYDERLALLLREIARLGAVAKEIGSHYESPPRPHTHIEWPKK